MQQIAGTMLCHYRHGADRRFLCQSVKAAGRKNITGVDVNKNVLEQALADGVIDRAYENAGAYLAEADVIICCIYPKAVTEFLRQAVPFIKKRRSNN